MPAADEGPPAELKRPGGRERAEVGRFAVW